MLKNANWWEADKDEVHGAAMQYVRAIDMYQAQQFNKFRRLEALYDTNPRTNEFSMSSAASLHQATENCIASAVDTLCAEFSTTEVRARVQTDDGDWEQQRTARRLEYYTNSLAKLYKVGRAVRAAFKAACVKGTGFVKVAFDASNRIKISPVRVDDIVVDELECVNGNSPMSMHHRTLIDKDVLKSKYPKSAAAIEAAQTGTGFSGMGWRLWAGYRPVKSNEIVVFESWRLPTGTYGEPGYKAGRHCIYWDGHTLLDEDWHKEFFPLARIVWDEPISGYYGISGAERSAGLQRAHNKSAWQIDRTQDRAASPTTWVHLSDANLATQTSELVQNSTGQFGIYKTTVPTTVDPPMVNQEIYNYLQATKAQILSQFGVSPAATTGRMPAGIESAVAMREQRDQATDRHATQEAAFERLWLDVLLLMIDCCKDLGAEAPVIMKSTKFGRNKITWAKVDMDDVAIQLVAASALSQTPAGRAQTVTEWATAGIITAEQSKRLIDHPDVARETSLFNAAMEAAERDIELMHDGHVLSPEPLANLELTTWRVQQQALLDIQDNAPERIVENMRQYLNQCAAIINPPAPANSNVAPMAGPAGLGLQGAPPPGMATQGMLGAAQGMMAPPPPPPPGVPTGPTAMHAAA